MGEIRVVPVDKHRHRTGVTGFWQLACKNTQLPEPWPSSTGAGTFQKARLAFFLPAVTCQSPKATPDRRLLTWGLGWEKITPWGSWVSVAPWDQKSLTQPGWIETTDRLEWATTVPATMRTPSWLASNAQLTQRKFWNWSVPTDRQGQWRRLAQGRSMLIMPLFLKQLGDPVGGLSLCVSLLYQAKGLFVALFCPPTSLSPPF